MQVDLHSHSTASDGMLSPSQLVLHARTEGVAMLALTDHDSTAGIEEAVQTAQAVRLRLVPGVEVSATWGQEVIHVVGLNIDAAHAELQQGLAGLRDFRDWRAQEIARKLARHGIASAYEGARAYAQGSIVGRSHFARFLVEQGHARTVHEVFKSFLVRGKPGYVPGQWASLEQAVSWITGAGGQAVLAHPARCKLGSQQFVTMLSQFKDCGGTGIEVVSGSHTADDCVNMARYAKRFGLLASAGSDYHGPESSWIELGRLPLLPVGCRAIWETWNIAT